MTRVGADESVVCAAVSDQKRDGARIAQKILQSPQPRLIPVVADCSVSASIGIASYPAYGRDLEALLAAGDRAMYSVKAGGKNGYQFA